MQSPGENSANTFLKSTFGRMANAKTNIAKWTAIGSIFVFLAVALQGVNEVLIKSHGLTVIQVNVIRFGFQCFIASSWWIIKKPTSPFVISDPRLLKESRLRNSPQKTIMLRYLCYAIQF